MASQEEERKSAEAPVQLIAKIEDLALNNVVEAKVMKEEINENNDKDKETSKGIKKAIIVEKATGTPLVTVRSRRSIMESRFRLTLKTWDDVWRSTSWAKNPPGKMKAAIKDAPAVENDTKKRPEAVSTESVNDIRIVIDKPEKLSNSVSSVKEELTNGIETDEETLRKVVSDTNVNDKEPEKPILHISSDEDVNASEKETEVEEEPTPATTNESDIIVEEQQTMCNGEGGSAEMGVEAKEDYVESSNNTGDETVVAEGTTVGPVPKKIKNTRFMIVPSVQVPIETEDNDKAETAGSSDSEEVENAASRNRVPMFESRLNELTMVESQLKKLDFKPMHLELPEDRDSDDSANSKTITAAEGKTMKIKDALPPRRNNSLEGAYTPQSKKKSTKIDAKPTWGWLSIFRKKTPSQTTSATPTPKPSPPTASASSQKAKAPAGTHQSRSRQPQRHTTTVASARRMAQQQAANQANARIVLIQVNNIDFFKVYLRKGNLSKLSCPSDGRCSQIPIGTFFVTFDRLSL